MKPRPIDDRIIHHAIRLPGSEQDVVVRGKKKKKFVSGEVIDNPDRLRELAADPKNNLDLPALQAQGIISGNW